MNLRVFWALSIFLMIGLIGLLILQTQLLAQKSEFISSSQRELVELSKENSEHAPLSFSTGMTELDKLAQNLNFEKIDKLHYIRSIESTVLAR